MDNSDESPAVAAAACVLHNFCLLVDAENIDKFFDYDGDDEGDCELPAYVPRPLAVANRNHMAI